MTLDEMIGNFDRLIGDLDSITEKEIETTATDGLLLLDRRITSTGESANGPLKDYVPSYKAFKQKAGKYRGFVDLQFTTQMWASIGIVEQKNEAGKFVVVIGGRDEFTRKKMAGNEKARPGVYNLKTEEVTILREDSGERLTATVKEYLQQ